MKCVPLLRSKFQVAVDGEKGVEIRTARQAATPHLVLCYPVDMSRSCGIVLVVLRIVQKSRTFPFTSSYFPRLEGDLTKVGRSRKPLGVRGGFFRPASLEAHGNCAPLCHFHNALRRSQSVWVFDNKYHSQYFVNSSLVPHSATMAFMVSFVDPSLVPCHRTRTIMISACSNTSRLSYFATLVHAHKGESRIHKDSLFNT
jgi:hypothetical protein